MANDKQTAPERTAMQELIDWIQENEIRMPNAQRIVAKAIEFRDTVEKKQLMERNIAWFTALDYTPDQAKQRALDWYNEKYGTDE